MSNQNQCETATCSAADRACTSESLIYSPRVDIVETKDELLLYADLPGVAREDLDIRYEDRQLVIEGKVAERQEASPFLQREYGIGDFHRTFAIGERVDTGRIQAELHDGVLVVHLPKTEAVKPRRIEVRAN